MSSLITGGALALSALLSLFASCGHTTSPSSPRTAAGVTHDSAVSDEGTLRWHGKAKSLEVRAVNGPIHAVPGDGDEAEVVARFTKGEHVPPLRLRVVERGSVTLACVVADDHPADGNDDDDDDDDADDRPDCALGGRARDAAVDLVVHVPKGVKFSGWTANGPVDADGLDGEVEAHAQNGSVHIATSGIARASTVNGSIDAKLGATRWDGTIALESVNGRVDVQLPPGVGAALNADTMHGQIRVGVPMSRAKVEDTHVEGQLGGGGGGLRVHTVNGPIEIR